MAAEREVPMSECILFLFFVLPFIAIFFSRALARMPDSRASERIWQEASGKAFSVLSIALAFDPDHALVWETQVPMLQLVAESGRRGISVTHLREAYFESACHYPEIYDGFTFEQWLEFLEDARLVTRTGKHVLLTSKGREFLHYRITAEAAIATSPPGCRCIT
jgi:hypothetical protein